MALFFMENTLVAVPVVVPVTEPDHVVDHKWSIGVPRLSSYIWLSRGVIFQREHFYSDAGRGFGDQS